MKQIFVLFILLITFLSQNQAQEESDSKERNHHQDHMVIDFGYETFNASAPSFRWYNNGLNIQFFYDYIIAESGFSLAIGGGFSTQSYYSDSQIRRNEDKTILYSDWVPQSIPYKRNKFTTSWLEVPFEIRYRSKLDNAGYRWKISAGAKLGFLVDAHDKWVDQQGIKYKTYYFPDINNLRFGLVGRAGYGKINLTAFFSLTEFFVPNRGPESKQISIAISLLPF